LLRKVNRKAREGDYVRMNEQKYGAYFIDGKIYGPVYKRVGVGELCANDNPVYKDFHNRTSSTVEVFEVVEAIPKIEKSAKQQRAELIEKAKDFVEAMKDREGNVFDKVGRLSRLEFYRKNNRVTCVINPWDNYSKRSTGRATCLQGDVFNEHIGQAIAFAKAKNISIPVEFLEAVQPSEVVPGMYCEHIHSGSKGEVTKLNAVTNYWDGTGDIWGSSSVNLKIIDDTNAQYEVTS
jgi:hypothetical protein